MIKHTIHAVVAEITLSENESKELSTHLETIKAGMSTFVAVGEALAAIRDKRLYRSGAPNFESFCRNILGMSAKSGHNLISGFGIVQTLEARGDFQGHLPANEAQVRPLRAVPNELLPAVWKEVLEAASSKPITGNLVATVARKYLPAPADASQNAEPIQLDRTKKQLGILRKSLEETHGDHSARALALLAEIESLLNVNAA